jgi:hypothetical protein
MLQGLFYISLFLITIFGILILKPAPVETETRNEVTRNMALFLERTPTLLEHPLHLMPVPGAKLTEKTPPETPIPAPPVRNPIDLSYKGTSLHFQNRDDYYGWIYENVARDAEGFLGSLDATLDPEQKLEILERAGEVGVSGKAKSMILEMLLKEAASQIKIKDAGHEQLVEKYLSLYLEHEPDAATAKRRVEDILHPGRNLQLPANNTQHP